MSTDRKAKIDAAKKKSGGTGANAIVVGGIVAIVAVILVVAGVIWSAQQDKGGDGSAPASTEMGQPFNPYPDAELVEGAPTVHVYEDFRCPACKIFEDAFGQSITELAQDGKIALQVHLKTVIDTNFNQDNSAIAASNALCAADQGVWTEYHKALFDNQPEEPNEFSQEQFEQLAEQAGLSGEKLDAWTECAQNETYVDYVKSVDDQSVKDGVTGTPSLSVGDTKVNWGSFATEDGQPDIDAFEEVLTSGEVPQDRVAQQ